MIGRVEGARRAGGQAWLPYAVHGVFLAAWMCAWSILGDHTPWTRALVIAFVAAPGFAATMWFTDRGERAKRVATLDGMSRADRRAVVRAAARGTPPADPKVRAAAAALVRGRLDRHTRQRTFALVVFAVFAAMSLICFLVSGWWYLTGTGLFAALLIWTVRYPGQLQRKLVALEVPPSPAPPAKTGA